MDNNKLVSKLHEENIQLEAKNTMLEKALKQKDKIYENNKRLSTAHFRQ